MLTAITGPYRFEEINTDNVYETFLMEKKMWRKTEGRMLTHSILSFHKDELITPSEVLEFAIKLCQKNYEGYQVLIAIHEDKDHLHSHMLINSVSYVNGLKLRETREDLRQLKATTNEMCAERQLTIAEKNKNFEGQCITKQSIWNQNKYHAVRKKDSFFMHCYQNIIEAKKIAQSKEEFMCLMEKEGWNVQWDEKRKHILFQNKDGSRKVRDSTISKTYNITIDKTSLLDQFNQNKSGNNVSNSNFDNGIVADTRKNIYNQKKYKTRLNDHCIEERNFNVRDREIER